MKFQKVFFIAVSLFLAVSLNFAAGSLLVRVMDESNLPLPGATVTLSNKDKLIADMPLLTNVDGVAFFPVLPIGPNYICTVQFPGFATQKVEDIRIIGGKEEQTVNVQMIAEIKEVVKVIATRDVVKTDDPTTSVTFSESFINDLPVAGREYQSVLARAAGVQDEDQDGNPTVKGSRERDFKALVDGVSNVDPLTGQFMSDVNPDAIEEIEVITGGAGAEFSRAQGGFAKITTKQGSNEFSGSFNFIYRSKLLDGNGASDLPTDLFNDYKWYNPALQLSGAIIKDKLFWAVSHEYFDVGYPVNTLSSAIVVINKRSRHFDKLTWQVTGKNKVIFQASADPNRFEGLGIDTLTEPVSGYNAELGGPTYTVTWQSPVSPKLLVTSLVAYSDTGLDIMPMTYNAINRCLTDPRNEQNLPGSTTASCYDLRTGETSGSFWYTWHDERQRLTVRSDMEYFVEKFMKMSHRLKAGFIVEDERYFKQVNYRPFIVFWSGQTSGIYDPGSGEQGTRFSGYADVYNFIPETSRAKGNATTAGFYFEDSIRPIRTLTIDMGFRVDREVLDSPGFNDLTPLIEGEMFEEELLRLGQEIGPPGLTDEQYRLLALQADYLPQALGVFTGYEDEYTICEKLGDCSRVSLVNYWHQKVRKSRDFQISNVNIAPRFGFSWDPWNKGKSKIFGSYGRYYDKLFLAVPLWEQEAVQYQAIYALGGTGVNEEQARANTVIADSPYYNSGVSVRMIDKDIKTPHSDEITLGFETEIATETSIKMMVTKREYKDQLQDIDINHYAGDYGPNDRCNPATGTVILGYEPDGTLDDCTGRYEFAGQGPPPTYSPIFRFVPDGIPDIFVANPWFNEIFYISNFNRAVYKDFELELTKRRHHHWELQASYVYSVSRGDAEDFNQSLGDDPTTLEDEKGYLSTDQRHVIKVNTTMEIPAWNVRLGALVTWASGLPYSIVLRDTSIDANNPYIGMEWGTKPRFRTTYPSHQRNDQRNASYWNFDLRAQKDIPIKKTMISVFMDIFNVLNDDALRIYTIENRRMVGVRRFGRQFQVGFKAKF